MTDVENHTEYAVRKAAEKLLGTKFCYGCQKHRPIKTGKLLQRSTSKVWKCGECIAKTKSFGFSKRHGGSNEKVV